MDHSLAASALGDPAAHSVSKHRKTASGSDFSTYDIGRALDMPAEAEGLVRGHSNSISASESAFEPAPQPHDSHLAGGRLTTAGKAHLPESLGDSHNPTTDLADLFDLSQLYTVSAVDSRFREISHDLLHNYKIEIRTATSIEQLELLEIEFYLFKSGCHEDPFTHASHEQSQSGRW